MPNENEKPNKKGTYKWCFVPRCKNTSISASNKVFFHVPQEQNRRKKWFAIAHRADAPTKSNYYCCQDHFNLTEDMENYLRFSMCGGKPKLKQGVMPHIFECQPNRTKIPHTLHRLAFQKLNRKREVAEILAEDLKNKENISTNANVSEEPPDKLKRNEQSLALSNSEESSTVAISNVNVEPIDVVGPEDDGKEKWDLSEMPTFGVLSKGNTRVPHQRSQGVQTQTYLTKPHVRSKYTLCKPSVCDASCQTILEMINEKNLLVRNKGDTASAKSNTSDSTAPLSSKSCSSDYHAHSHSENQISSNSEHKVSFNDSDEVENIKKEMCTSALRLTKYFISINPKTYIGISDEWLWIIDMLHDQSRIVVDNIYLTLMKIRTNDTYNRLGNQFGLSTSQSSRIFTKTVQPLAHLLKTLIYCPTTSTIKKALPIPFRAYFSHVHAIVDAFEIQIEKPSDPVNQALTWSEYKKCNTLKYIVSCTPDGLINFISRGYGGRISDVMLFEICGIMDILPNKVGVMADRGFKQIQNVLNKKKCELIRPPSVSTSTKPTKEEVIHTKRIASLRIHIERVIRRIREYKILEPHSCLDVYIMPSIDSIVTIVAALINLQSPIIKT